MLLSSQEFIQRAQAMVINTLENAQKLKIQVIGKIQNLLKEYAVGSINREQFNRQYESYAQQLESAQQALDTCEMMIVTEAEIESALSLPQTYIGKAVGLAVYQNHTGALIERLGDFEVSVFDISPVLSDFVRLREARKNIAPRVENMSDNRWLLFTDAQTTTVVTLFHDEPAQEQISEIVRIHQAFETIGKAMLEKRNQDPKKIASSFGAYVQRIPRRA